MSEQQQRPASLAQLLRQLDEQGITDYRRYKAVRQYLNFAAREKNIPLSGKFELTPFCNFSCKMCYVYLNKDQLQGRRLLTVDEWKSIMGEAVKHGMMYATLTGGECLTYPGFQELYLHLRSMGVEITILSNGALMNADMVSFLKAAPPAAVQITLYGASEDAYERVTGQRAFTTVTENIRRLKAVGIPLTLAITPSAYMTDGEEIVRLAHEMGVPFNINSGLMSPREETGRFKADADLDVYIRMMKLRRQLQGYDVEIAEDADDLPDVADSSGEKKFGVTCGAGRSGFSVSWCGEMRPCHTFPGEAHPVPEIGFAEAWKRTNALANSFPLPVECQGCSYQRICKFCVAEHASGAPVGHANLAICAHGKRLVCEKMVKI